MVYSRLRSWQGADMDRIQHVRFPVGFPLSTLLLVRFAQGFRSFRKLQ